MQPGDLVGVDQSGAVVKPGIYAPVDAILEQLGTNFVFKVSESAKGDTAKQVEVKVFEAVGTLRRIEAAGAEPLDEGTQIVAAGAAFLADGERINIARTVELGR